MNARTLPAELTPGFIERTLTALNGAAAEIAADNAAAAHVEEQRIDELLSAYIDNANKRFEFGGIHNLLKSIANIMGEKSQLEGDDYESAANFIYECADKCDMKYAEPDHPFSGSCGRD